MSMFYNPLTCTGCAQAFPFPSMARSYTNLPEASGQSTAHLTRMLLSPVWCHECENASWVERIPTAREFAIAAGLRRRPCPRGHALAHEYIDDELLVIDDADFRGLYEHLAHRRAAPSCLVCASLRFTPIDVTRRDTPIVHGACWDSPIEFNDFPISSCGLRSGRDSHAHHLYDVEGRFAWARLHVQTSGYRLIVVLHAGRQDPCCATLDGAIDAIVRQAGERAPGMLAPLAKAGVPAALGLLGALHYAGEGVAHSGIEAARLLDQAKGLGDACAAHNLASLYATGAPDVAQDIERARQLYGEARAMGGQYERDDFYAQADFCAATHTFYRQT